MTSCPSLLTSILFINKKMLRNQYDRILLIPIYYYYSESHFDATEE